MENKPRKLWIAGTLALLSPGLGHLYSGDLRKGIYLFIGQILLIPAVSVLIMAVPTILCLICASVLVLSYIFYNISDAIITAKRNSEFFELKKYNSLFFYFLFFLIANIIVSPLSSALIKENLLKTYHLPTGSMIPTLIPGDHIFTNNLVFKIKKPERGEVVTFKPPHKDTVYIKRIIGTAGDVIHIKDKQLFVNGVIAKENYIKHSDTKIFPDYISPRDNFGPLTVPEKSVFLLGDNRDNSDDSRFWGTVEVDKIHGKVILLYWAKDRMTGKISWNRIFEGLKF